MTSLLPPTFWVPPFPGLGERTDVFGFEVLDQDLNVYDTLSVTTDANPTISANTERSVARTLDGMDILAIDLAAVDPLADRVRPIMVLPDGSRFPLGVYVFGERKVEPLGIGTRTAPNPTNVSHTFLMDQAWILDQPLDRSVGLAAGGAISSLFVNLAFEVGITHIQTDPVSTTASEPTAWAAGSSRYAAMENLATMMGCSRPYFDNEGVLRCRVAPSINDSVDFSYGPGSVFADTILETDDSYRAPNRYIAIGNGSSAPIVGVYNVPSAAPHSYARRGFVVATTVDAPGVANTFAATQAAWAASVQDSRAYFRAGFSTPLNPAHDLNMLIGWGDGVWLEVEQRLELRPGGNHEHILARMW